MVFSARSSSTRAWSASLLRFLHHTPVRTPMKKWLTHRRVRCLYNVHKTQQKHIHTLSGMRARDLSTQIIDLCLRPYGNWDREITLHVPLNPPPPQQIFNLFHKLVNLYLFKIAHWASLLPLKFLYPPCFCWITVILSSLMAGCSYEISSKFIQCSLSESCGQTRPSSGRHTMKLLSWRVDYIFYFRCRNY